MTKKKWTQKELKEFEAVVNEKRDNILSSIEEARSRADDIIKEGNQSSIYSSHMADAGSDQQSLEHAYSIINRESKFYKEFYDYLNNTAKDKKAVDAVRILLMALIRAEDELCLEMNEEELKLLREKWGEYVEKLIEISQ